jgi:hypothetical protein
MATTAAWPMTGWSVARRAVRFSTWKTMQKRKTNADSSKWDVACLLHMPQLGPWAFCSFLQGHALHAYRANREIPNSLEAWNMTPNASLSGGPQKTAKSGGA